MLTRLSDKLGLKREGQEDEHAVSVDFSSPALSYRVGSQLKQQGLSKAIGLKGKARPRVLDATAGFGKDAFLLASQGCTVQLMERDPLVFALLQDGVTRGLRSSDGDTAQSVARLHLVEGDFLKLNPNPGQWDVIYLDPMFPESKKSARVKKDMFALQEHLGAAEDAEQMWVHACALAHRRVVVKRGKSAPSLGSRKPDIQYKGTSSRFDVYLTPK